MKIIDKPLLRRFAGPGVCEHCKRKVSSRDPHHLFGRGMGGGRRFDIPLNLISLCSAFSGGENCHARYHAGQILREMLLAIVAKREGCLQSDIEAEIWRLRRL